MTLKRNGFDVGPDGTGLTVGNSDDTGDDALSVVSAGTSNTLTYSAAAAVHGAYGIAATQGGTAASLIQMTDAGGSTSFAARIYLAMQGYPPDSAQFGIQVRSTADAYICRVYVGPTGLLKIADTAGSNAVIGTVPLGLSTVTRLEFYGTGLNGATGNLTAAAYAGETTTPIDLISASSVTTTGATDRIRYGKMATGTMASFSFDSLAQNIGTATPIGPAVAAVATWAYQYDVRVGG